MTEPPRSEDDGPIHDVDDLPLERADSTESTEQLIARLGETALFGGLPPSDLARLATLGQIVHLEPDEFLIQEGQLADSLYLVLHGELDVTKRSGGSEIPLDRVGPGSLQGDIAALEGGRRLASVQAVTPTEVFQLPKSVLGELLKSGPDVAFAIISKAVRRLRSMEAALREREKLAGLGTLAAGLAHELNNPAAAAARSVQALKAAVERAETLPRPETPPRAPERRNETLSALDRADRIDALEVVAGGDAAARALFDAGWTTDALSRLGSEEIAWLAANAEVHLLLDELHMSVGRLSAIVGAVKGYTYLDRAPIQCVDVTVGLDQTLIIMQHRLKEGVEVRREIAADLPEVEVYGSELNQVWTNLIDNAIDAMDGKGVLEIGARRDPDGDGICVSICDSGAGIEADVRERLFEPFFTTKGPGKGIGLGLHIVHSTIARHGGRIDVESEPGRTCFTVTLGATLPTDRAPATS